LPEDHVFECGTARRALHVVAKGQRISLKRSYVPVPARPNLVSRQFFLQKVAVYDENGSPPVEASSLQGFNPPSWVGR
jgi:hypothetical protein